MARSFQHMLDLPSGSGHDISQEIADHWCAMCYQMLSPMTRNAPFYQRWLEAINNL